MELSIEHPGILFSLFYLLSFVLVSAIVLYKSVKWGFHLRSVLLLITTLTLFTILGSRLFTIPFEDWFHVLQSNAHEFNNRSAIGALIFAIIALIISQRIFGFNRPILDLYAWLGPVLLGIIKFGCFFNGCCYGVASNNFLAVQYPKGTPAHFNHWSEGLIAPGMEWSMPVHPVQLYESFALFLIGYIVYKTHHYWRKNFSAILSVVVLIFIMRFGIEFLRDANSSQFNTLYYAGLSLYHWSMLGLGVVMITVLFIYEKSLKTELINGRQNSPYLHSELIYIVMISVLLYSFNDLFSTYERFVIWIKFFPAILLSVIYLFTDNRLKPYRWAASLTVLLPIYVLAQTTSNKKQEVATYNRIDLGSSMGNFSNAVLSNPRSTECGTSYDEEYFKQSYWIVGGGYSHIEVKEKTKTTYGLNLSGGQINSTGISSEFSGSKTIFSINPYIKMDKKWWGGGVGLQLGEIPVDKNEEIDGDDIDQAVKTNTAIPEVYLRLGPKKYLDVDFNYGFLNPSAFPTLFTRASVGTGLGISDNYSFRFGRILNLETNYVSAEALLSQRFGVNLMYVFKEDNSYLQDFNPRSKVVFSLNYRFGNKAE